MRKSNVQIGIKGEYLALAKLTDLGYVAALTQKNTENIDVLIANPVTNKAASIQIKTTTSKSDGWVLGKKVEKIDSENLFYIFININDFNNPTYHVINARDLAKSVSENHQKWLDTPNRKGEKHNDSDIRMFHDKEGKYKDNWEIIEKYLNKHVF